MMIKNIFIFSLLALTGCTGNVSHYVLDVDMPLVSKRATMKKQIAVDKVEVPAYMQDVHVSIKNDDGSMGHENEMWAVPTEKALTDALIRGLQEKFDNPNVKRYPWDIERSTGIRVKVTIRRFLYENGEVNLEANYSVGAIKSLTPRGYRYTTSVPAQKSGSDIVRAMNEAFSYLVNDIGKRIN